MTHSCGRNTSEEHFFLPKKIRMISEMVELHVWHFYTMCLKLLMMKRDKGLSVAKHFSFYVDLIFRMVSLSSVSLCVCICDASGYSNQVSKASHDEF